MNRSLTKNKTNLIVNSLIDLKEDDGNGKGRYFISRFIEPGLAHYKELGDIVITKETLDKFIQSMVGCPVIIDHEDVNDKNVDKLRVGTISRVWYNEMDGWYYCEGILTDSKAIDLVKNKGWNVSCSYSFVSDDTQKTYHGKPIDMIFTDGEFLHLAIVEDPRYEGANIVVNKKDDDIEWITVKGNHIPIKKGQSKDEAVKEFLKDKEGKSGDSLKGKYAKEDVDFDEEQAKKDIEEAKKQGHKDIDDIADYLGLDSEEVIALTGEGYEDEDGGNDENDLNDLNRRLHGDIVDSPSLQKFDEMTKMRFTRELSGSLPGRIEDIVSETGLSEKEVRTTLDKLIQEGQVVEVQDPRTNTKSAAYFSKHAIKENEKWQKEKNKEQQKRKSAKFDSKRYEKLQKEYKDIKKRISPRQAAVDRAYQQERLAEIREELEAMDKDRGKTNNSIGDITMTVLNDLTDFIKKVVSNEKEEDEMKKVDNEDKRKLIDEVGGILKDKVDEELWRTVVGKLEKIAYEPSEDSKTDNEDDKKEAKNKCKNEEDKEEKEEKEKVEDKEDKEEDPTKNKDDEEEDEEKTENKKVKNSMKDFVMGGSNKVEEKSLYTSRAKRLEEGNKY